MNTKNILIIVLIIASLSAAIGIQFAGKQQESGGDPQTMPETARQTQDRSQPEDEGNLETVTYSISYKGSAYAKEAWVYVPAEYSGSEPMNVLYLMHGSQGSGKQLAETMAPLFDAWIQTGSMQPMLVVFPTYYPDRSFVVLKYSEDYPLNHFFAIEEISELVKTVEGSYRTYTESTDDAGLSASRRHRAFGGYSMGGVTTWDILAYQADYFAYFIPMAGDCWLRRVSDEPVSDLLVRGLEEGEYSSDDFRIIAMVGGSDGTKNSIQPQIEALRREHADLITDENLIYWENEGGGHNLESLEREMEHGIPYLWTLP